MARLIISQKDNYLGNFGDVLRSSAIFYYKSSPNFETTISFLNYWKLKRNLTVAVVASVRDLSGKLLRRERLHFNEGSVINYSPDLGYPLEGSVEIEVFGLENLVIPYSAIMAVYKSERGISMVHSYARAYSRHEVEEGRTISVGEESCWTIRDSETIRSFGIFHNGPLKLGPQRVAVRALSESGATAEGTLLLEELAPYQSVKIIPSDIIPNLKSFLGGKPGHVSLSFKLGEGFTRMLVANESVDGTDIQVTHSNFNYSVHLSDQVVAEDQTAYMHATAVGIKNKNMVIYPDSDIGKYQVQVGRETIHFKNGKRLTIPFDEGTAYFKRKEGVLPTRIVTALEGRKSESAIPFECSLGISTKGRPPKRFWWTICASHGDIETKIYFYDICELYGGISAGAQINLKLYSSKGTDTLEATFDSSALKSFEAGQALEVVFPDSRNFLNGDFGYFTAFCEYGGLFCFSSLENPLSMTLEHAF